MKNGRYWKVVLPLTLVLAALAFIPALIPGGVAAPYLFGMPRTLWVSMVLSLCIFAVLIVAMLLSKEN